MPLGHAAVFFCFTQREHVAVIVQRDAVQQRVDFFDHRTVSAASGCTIGREPGVQLVDLIVRDGLDGHVADADLIGVVGALALHGCAVHRHAALHADGHRHADQLCRREEFPRAGNRVVVNDASCAQAFHPRGIDRGGGGVGRERIGRMNMIVDVLRHHGREFGGLQNLFEICKAFFPRGRVEFVQNVDLDHRAALSSA